MLVKFNSKMYDPFYGLVDFLDTPDFSKLFSNMRNGNVGISGDNVPKMNIFFDEDSNKFVVKTILAGFDKKDVKVYIKRGSLNIEHRTETKESNKKDVVREISSTSFHRKVAIPDNVDIDSVESKYDDGVLTISFNVIEEKVKEITF